MTQNERNTRNMDAVEAVTGVRPTNLETLKALMQADAEGQMEWADLPVFGGEDPVDTLLVWSWDEKHLLMGNCADSLRIVERH